MRQILLFSLFESRDSKEMYDILLKAAYEYLEDEKVRVYAIVVNIVD